MRQSCAGNNDTKNPVRLFIIVILSYHIISRFYEKREKLKNMIYPRMIDSKNRQARRSISRRFMRIVKQMQKVFSNGYKGIVQYKSLVCHPHVNLVATTRSRRPSRSLSAGQGILTFWPVFRGAPLSGRCMSQFFMRPPFRAVFTESEKIAIADEWPDFCQESAVRNSCR